MERETQYEYHNVETNKKLSDGSKAVVASHDLSMIATCSPCAGCGIWCGRM